MKLNRILLLSFIIGFAAGMVAMSATSWAQNKASDKLVKYFAETAFQSLEPVIADADGKEIKIDKTKASQILVPNDQIRQVILVANQVSKAASCNLEQLATSYWVAYRKSLKMSGKWTPQQRIFMGRVFSAAVGIASAKEAKGNDGEKEFELKSFKSTKCNDKSRAKIKAEIEQNIALLQKT